MDQRSGKRPATSRIGLGTPRSHARRLAAGKGRYADDLRFPRLLHAAFVRSPHPHARIVDIRLADALAVKGVFAAFDAAALSAVCTPWQTRLATWPAHRSPPQLPLQMRAAIAECLGLGEHRVRVMTPDIGGGFGVKLHVYDDEMAVCAAAVLTGRAVKFVCDRMEAFGADIHARAHSVGVSLA